jgi:hypothetical protein
MIEVYQWKYLEDGKQFPYWIEYLFIKNSKVITNTMFTGEKSDKIYINSLDAGWVKINGSKADRIKAKYL